METFHLKIGRRILKFATLSMKRKKGEFIVKKTHFCRLISLLKFATYFHKLTAMFQKLAPCRHAKSLIMYDKYHFFASWYVTV